MKKTLVDIGMVVAILLLMPYSMIGETLHELIGITMFLLFICHHILNRKWLSSFSKGKWTAFRLINTSINILMFLFMLIMMFSAITISRHVFTFLNLGGASLGRILHLIGANWLFVLMSIHLGFHINVVAGRIGITKNGGILTATKILSVSVAVYGIYAIYKRQVLSYMFATSMYAYFDFSEPVILFILDYIAIMILFAVVGAYLSKGLIYLEKSNNKKNVDDKKNKEQLKAAKKKKRNIAIGCVSILVIIAILVWGVPYMRRHFVTVNINRQEVTNLPKVDLPGKTLVIQFTRTGNSDFDEDVDAVSSASLMLDENGQLVGNSELLAQMTQASTNADLYAIRVKKLYPSTYNGTVGVAGKELSSESYPELNMDEPLPNIKEYDRVILVFPLWWGTVPKAVEGFLSQEDFSGTEVYLILTHGGSGAGSVPHDLPEMIPGGHLNEDILLVYDDDVDEASEQVYEWLVKRQ